MIFTFRAVSFALLLGVFLCAPALSSAEDTPPAGDSHLLTPQPYPGGSTLDEPHDLNTKIPHNPPDQDIPASVMAAVDPKSAQYPVSLEEKGMEIELSLVMDRISSRAGFIPYLKKIHNFLLETSILGDNFSSYYLQVDDMENATEYKMPQDFEQFYSMLASQEEAPNDEENFYILGLWNGNMDFLTASEGDWINSFSLIISLSADNKGNIARDYKANIDFCFLAGDKNEYEERKRIAEKIIEISISSLPFKYATFVDRKYISYYDGMPDIIIGGSLYCIKSELDTVKGFRRQVSEDIEEISPVQGFFDIHNPEHIQKAHKFEEELLQNHQFRQLLLR